jgi:hypothetical protein
VDDVIEGAASPRSYLHLAPGVDVLVQEGGIRLMAGGTVSAVLEFEGLALQRVVRADPGADLGWYFPAYGVRVPATTLVFALSQQSLDGVWCSTMLIRRGS